MTHRQLFFQHIAQTSEFPLALEIERAEGIFLYDTAGRAYIDLISGIGVSNVGHRHPAVLAAVHAQLERYMHLMVYGEYVQGPQTQLAQALIGSLEGAATPYGPISSVYFTNSGAEAIEGAMKVAKRFTGRTELIAYHHAYHGSTQGALSLSGDEQFKRNYRPLLPDVRHIQYGSFEDLARITTRTAAVIMEVVQGEAGVRLPAPAYLRAVQVRCREVGALLIFDEIQTGFGRTGTFWAFQGAAAGPVVPDLVVSAKGMGGGMPIGAFMAPEAIMAVFKNNPMLGHITTFGGHPVSCAASLATLQTIQNQRLYAEAGRKGELIKSLLVHPAIRQVRGKGLMLAIEFDSFEVLKPIIDRAMGIDDVSRRSPAATSQPYIITDWFLFCNNAMRLAPPLTITDDEIRLACGLLLRAIG